MQEYPCDRVRHHIHYELIICQLDLLWCISKAPEYLLRCRQTDRVTTHGLVSADKCAVTQIRRYVGAARAQPLAQGFADLCFTQPDRFNSKSCVFSAVHPTAKFSTLRLDVIQINFNVDLAICNECYLGIIITNFYISFATQYCCPMRPFSERCKQTEAY